MKRLVLILLLGLSLSGRGQCVKESYTREIGIREQTGRNDGFDVEKYLASTGLGKGYAWCAAFVNWNLQQCGCPTPNSPAWSPSWFPNYRVIYAKGSVVYGDAGYQRPEAGDVFGIYFPTKKRIAHAGFIDEWKAGRYATTVEGNTNEAGSREGDGVYRKWRLKSQIYKISRWR